MERVWTLLSAGAGAGLMYLIDPDRGRRRRALLRDKAVRLAHEMERGLALGSKDLVNRSKGLVAEVKHRVTDDDADDDVLRERVRARIGHVVSHPHAIRVTVQDGVVRLEGPILEQEHETCILACAAIPGVRLVEDALEVHDGRDIPALQGGRSPVAARRATPAAQLVKSALGAGAVLAGRRRRGFMGLILRGLGAAILLSELLASTTVQELVKEMRPQRAA